MDKKVAENATFLRKFCEIGAGASSTDFVLHLAGKLKHLFDVIVLAMPSDDDRTAALAGNLDMLARLVDSTV